MKSRYKIFIVLIVILFIYSCSGDRTDLKIVDTMLNEEFSYFYTDLQNFNPDDPKLPIGVFDSGTGGLTVLDAIVNFDMHSNTHYNYTAGGDSIRDFQNEHFIYLADQANMPYGNYEAHKKSSLLREHILKDVQFLLDEKFYQSGNDVEYQTDKSRIKALVIACNTATAYGLEDINDFIELAGLDLKVIGVIGAGVRGALGKIKNTNNTIGVMATAGTVASNGYLKEFEKYLEMKIEEGDVSILQHAGIGLAGAIDGSSEFIDPDSKMPRSEYKGPSDKNESLNIDLKILKRYGFDWSENQILFEGVKEDPQNIQINSVKNYISYHVTTFFEKVRKLNNPKKVESIVLGCTHYPFFIDTFSEEVERLRGYSENGIHIYQDLIADTLHFIDPAHYLASELYEFLVLENLLNNGKISDSEFYISIPNLKNQNIELDKSGNFTYDYKYGRRANKIQEYVKRVPFSKNNINDLTAERLKEKIPYTYSLITDFNKYNPKVSYLEEDEKLK